MTTERITFVAAQRTFLILVVFAHPTRLRCAEGGMFFGDLTRDLLHLRPFNQTEGETGFRRSFADSRQPVELAQIRASVAACNAHVLSGTADQ